MKECKDCSNFNVCTNKGEVCKFYVGGNDIEEITEDFIDDNKIIQLDNDILGLFKLAATKEKERTKILHNKSYNSNHETYGVIKEEVEETFDEIQNLLESIIKYGNVIDVTFNEYWDKIKVDDVKEVTDKKLQEIENIAYNLVGEAIQIIACCMKGREK